MTNSKLLNIFIYITVMFRQHTRDIRNMNSNHFTYSMNKEFSNNFSNLNIKSKIIKIELHLIRLDHLNRHVTIDQSQIS